MCGIVGYVGAQEPAASIVLNGLRQLEYRGYDSAGLAVIDDEWRHPGAAGGGQTGQPVRRPVEIVLLLQGAASALGHTRWATHGPPSQRNAHPHSSPDGEIGGGAKRHR
jgi:glucosamine--fructose-6-phosphate aminotransferase (isomerizing)